ncbi:Skp1 family, tetramerization domain containing protein [Tritrichomonas foetus]|uniref:Elongin-C n=1 Tax=Tritrichomonas foetus TaxID=1144522 RepID=A0A1J4K425_9EUKA|nr:Skp1 family, tetramerization domain containing protein [Tritrichomonas foetus]|eukprot:OHT06201.1 Skp1 family, tetramerization domain containing protein [Tritrichomonas foetus]
MATLLELLKQQQRHEEEEEFEDPIPPMDALTLVSNDGYEFVIDKQTAMISLTIRNMLYGGANFEESETKIIRLPIRAIILERIIEYWHYRSQYSDHLDQLPKFDIDPKMAIELLQGAEYLQT